MRLQAATRLVVAEAEWWDELSKKAKQQYLEEHPNSQFAKGHKFAKESESSKSKAPSLTDDTDGTGTPKSKDVVPSGPHRKAPPDTDDVEDVDEIETKPKSRELTHQKVTPKSMKSGSPERRESAGQIKKKSRGLARGILRDSIGVGNAMVSVGHVLQGKTSKDDAKHIASFLGTIIGSSVMAAAIGTTGPVGFLAFMAIKHLVGAPLLDLAKKGFGIAKDKLMGDEDGDDVPRLSHQPSKSKDKDDKDDYGYWSKGTWHPQSKEAWERDYDQRGPGTKDDIKPRHASLRLLATDEKTQQEKQMQHLIETIADYAATGDIPEYALKKAQAEIDSNKPSSAAH
jgi:hypothetical protein